jgi:hypothetical protein
MHMNTKRLIAPLTALLLAVGAVSAAGAETGANPNPNGQPQMRGHGSSMMGMGGMNGNMMGSCPMMMGTDMHMDPKTAMQMHAEMMRAMSDIMLKYSNKLETPPSK